MLFINGGEDKEGDCTILAEFARLGGGSRARLIVMTVALDASDERGCYGVPPITLAGSVREDIFLIAEVIGAGEVAIQDAPELAKVVKHAGLQ